MHKSFVMNRPLNILTVCSGIGAPELALQQLGVDHNVVGQFEVDKFCCQLLADKYPHVPNYGDMSLWYDHIDELKKQPIDIMIGGTPCQSFSTAGLRKGIEDDRGKLAFTFFDMVKELRPEFFIWENVASITHKSNREGFTAIMQHILQCGNYGCEWRVLDAKYFGVPQQRRRVFVVGNLGGRCTGRILYESESNRWVKEKGYKAQQKDKHCASTIAANHGSDVGQMFIANNLTAYSGGNQVEDTYVKCLTTKYQRNTCDQDNYVQDGERLRHLTCLERERCQGFPDKYTQGFSKTQRCKMIGNSMAMPVIKWVIQRVVMNLH